MSTVLSEQEQLRRQAMQSLLDMGIDPFPANEFVVNAHAADILENYDRDKLNYKNITIAGRIMSRRVMGSASFFEIGSWCVVALWTVYLVMLINGLRQRQVISGTDMVVLPRGLPRVSVLVAGRNEEECFELCLRSLLRQDYPNLEIIAINDRSTDATGWSTTWACRATRST